MLLVRIRRKRVITGLKKLFEPLYKMFQMMCGTEPFPTDFKAKKYKLEKHFFMKVKNLVIGS